MELDAEINRDGMQGFAAEKLSYLQGLYSDVLNSGNTSFLDFISKWIREIDNRNPHLIRFLDRAAGRFTFGNFRDKRDAEYAKLCLRGFSIIGSYRLLGGLDIENFPRVDRGIIDEFKRDMTRVLASDFKKRMYLPMLTRASLGNAGIFLFSCEFLRKYCRHRTVLGMSETLAISQYELLRRQAEFDRICGIS